MGAAILSTAPSSYCTDRQYYRLYPQTNASLTGFPSVHPETQHLESGIHMLLAHIMYSQARSYPDTEEIFPDSLDIEIIQLIHLIADTLICLILLRIRHISQPMNLINAIRKLA